MEKGFITKIYCTSSAGYININFGIGEYKFYFGELEFDFVLSVGQMVAVEYDHRNVITKITQDVQD